MGTHPIFESDFDCLTEMEQILSRGIIPQLFDERVRPGTHLTLQVVGIRAYRMGAYRMKLSDGQYYSQYTMYSGHLEGLQLNCIIQVTKWMRCRASSKVILTITEANVVHTAQEVNGRLGNPVQWKLDEDFGYHSN